MKPVIIQEAVIAEWRGYAEKVLTGVTYQEAREYCEAHKWKTSLHGRECSLRIVREDEPLEDFPEVVKLSTI